MSAAGEVVSGAEATAGKAEEEFDIGHSGRSKGNSKEQVHAENLAEIRRLSNDIADEINSNIKKVLVTEDINFTGELSKSFHKVNSDDFVYLISNNPYAIPVDRGMPKGTVVNFDALLNWVKIKLGVEDEDQARDVTFRIRNKIISKGIAPTRFIKKAVNMFIMKYGVLTPSVRRARVSKKKHKTLTKVIKTLKKVYKATKKTAKFLNNVRNRV